MTRRPLALVATVALVFSLFFLALPAFAEQAAFTHYLGFDDTNGNGQLDCGEPVTIQTGYFARNGAPRTAGTIRAPTSSAVNLGYLGGSAFVAPDQAAGCFAEVTTGLDPHDTTFTAAFVCDPAMSNPPDQTFISVIYKEIYIARAGSPGFTSSVLVTSGASPDLTATEPQTFPTATCSGPATPLKVTKTASGNAVPGSPLTFQVTATNASSLGVGGVQLIDTVPPNTTFSSSLSSPGWVCVPNAGPGSVCRNPIGNILGNASGSAVFAVIVSTPLAAGVKTIPNTACVSEGPTQVDDCASVSVPTVGTPILALTKSLVSGTGTPGATLVFNVAVRNTGNQGAGNVMLTEIVPNYTTFLPSASDPGWVCQPSGASGSSCSFPVGALQAGSNRSSRFAVVLDSTLPAGVLSTANTACAESTDASTDCHSVTIPTAGVPALNIAKTLTSGDGTPGTTLLFAVAVQNTGNQGATLVTLTETVPGHTVFDPTKSDPAWVCTSPAAGSNCTLSLPSLGAGISRTASFAVTVDNPLPAGIVNLSNTACATASGVSITCSTVPVTPNAAARIALAKTYGSGPIHQGDHISFTLTATNTGNQDSQPLTLTDTVPPYTSFDLAASSPGWACSPNTSAGSTCTLALPGIPAGGSLTRSAAFLVSTLPPGVSQVANTACVAEYSPVETRTRVSSTCSQVTTPPEAKLASTLTASPKDTNHNGAADPGETLSYTLEIHCTSATAATGLAITPHLDPNLHFIPGSVVASSGMIATGNGPSDTSFQVDVSSLAPGGSITVTFDAVIDPATKVRSVATQALTAGTNFSLDASDDPGTPAPDDPTVTPISVPFLTEIPTLNTWGLLSLVLSLGCAGTGALWKYRL